MRSRINGIRFEHNPDFSSNSANKAFYRNQHKGGVAVVGCAWFPIHCGRGSLWDIQIATAHAALTENVFAYLGTNDKRLSRFTSACMSSKTGCAISAAVNEAREKVPTNLFMSKSANPQASSTSTTCSVGHRSSSSPCQEIDLRPCLRILVL